MTLMLATELVLSFLLACGFTQSFPNKLALGSLVSEAVWVERRGPTPIPLALVTSGLQVTVEKSRSQTSTVAVFLLIFFLELAHSAVARCSYRNTDYREAVGPCQEEGC